MNYEMIIRILDIATAALAFAYTIRFVKAAKKQDVIDMIRCGFFAILMAVMCGFW